MTVQRKGIRALRSMLVATVLMGAQLALSPPAFADLTNQPARTWGTNGRVYAVLPVGDRVFVAGAFSAVVDPSGVSYPAKNVAVFSAATGAADLAFDVRTNNAVFALATDGGSSLYLGGSFGSVSHGNSTAARAGLAAVDITTGAVTGWAPSVSGGQVDALAFSAATTSVYASGNFTSVSGGGVTSPHPYLARIAAGTGAVDGVFAANPGGRVRSLNVAADGSGLFLGGDFLSISGGSKTRAVAKVDLTTGAVLVLFAAAATNQTNLAPAYDLTSDSSRLYVAAAGSGGACTALDISTGALVWTDHANGNMQSVRLNGSALYCGGHFSGTGSFLGANRQKLAAVVATTGALLPFSPKINSALGTWALGTQPGDPNLYLGGDFTKVSGVAQSHFAEFLDSTLQRAPQPPTGLTADPAVGQVRLAWKVPSSDGGQSITQYFVFRGTSAGGENTVNALAHVSGSTLSYTDLTVSNGTTYYYEVAAQNSLDRSPLSAEASATPGTVTVTPPSAPQSVTATNPPGSIVVDWNPPAADGGAPVTSYTVYRGLASGAESPTPYAAGITGTAFTDLYNLVAGTTYYYTVTATNTAGEGPLSAEVSAVEQAGTPGPPVLGGSLITGGVELHWTIPPDGGSPILKFVLLRDGVKLAANIPPTQTTFVAPTAGPTDVHTYQVKAVNAVGGGQLSNKVTL